MTDSDKQDQNHTKTSLLGVEQTEAEAVGDELKPSQGLKRKAGDDHIADSSNGTSTADIAEKVVVIAEEKHKDKSSKQSSQDKPRISAAAKGKGKARKSFGGKYGKGKNDESDGLDDEDDDEEDDEEEDDDDELDDDDPADLFTEEDMDFLKGVENPASRTRRKVIDFKKMDAELRREEGRGEDDDDEDDSEEEDGDYVPN